MEPLGLFDVQHVQVWLEAGGNFLLFALLFACGLGLPLPEDIPLLLGGFLVATGKMHLIPAAVLAWCGIIGGDCVLYHLGKKYGRHITKVPFVGRHVTPQRMEWIERKFHRYGVWVVAVGRMFAGIRGAMVVAAGATRFNFVKFVIADGLAALVSGGAFMALGWWGGRKLSDNPEEIVRRIQPYKEWIFGIGGAAIVAIILLIWWRHRRRAREDAEREDAKT